MRYHHCYPYMEEKLDPNDPDTIWENEVFSFLNSVVDTFPKDDYDFCHRVEDLFKYTDEHYPDHAEEWYPKSRRTRWEVIPCCMPPKMLVRILMARVGKIPEEDIYAGLCSSLIRKGNHPSKDIWFDEYNKLAMCMRQWMLWIDKKLQYFGAPPLQGFYLIGNAGIATYPRVSVINRVGVQYRPIAELTNPKEIIVYNWPCQLGGSGAYKTGSPAPLEGFILKESLPVLRL